MIKKFRKRGRTIVQARVARLIESAGVKINGRRPFDIRVHDPKFYRLIATRAERGLGDAYTQGYWDCDRVDECIYKLLLGRLHHKRTAGTPLIKFLGTMLINLQSIRRVSMVADKHYNLGNDLFQAMLDKRMLYSCGYWKTAGSDKEARTLEEAQTNKLDLIACKLQFQKGMHVLDIGCGWGGAANYFAAKYGVRVTGITISEQQHQWSVTHSKEAKTRFLLSDYRTHAAKYDAIYSIGMFEHVGRKNYQQYMRIVRRNLKPHGRFLLHTIGTDYTLPAAAYYNSWVNANIFPNGELPSQKLLTAALENEFILDDWQNFGNDYDRTLMQWHKRFTDAWPKLKKNYDDPRFYRMWTYYLQLSAGAFRARHTQLWQLLLSPADTNRRPVTIPTCR